MTVLASPQSRAAITIELSCEINHEMIRVRKQFSARGSNYLVTFLYRQQEKIFF